MTMVLREIYTKTGKKEFIDFRTKIYAKDPYYVCTDKFILKSVLFDETDFIRKCRKKIVQAVENNTILAQAILIYNSAFPYVQVSFFDAMQNNKIAVELILSKARECKQEVNAKGIIIGLNAHLSYGVGILAEGFQRKISFDSQYNKSYYNEYFTKYQQSSLSVYRGSMKAVLQNFPKLETDKVNVRYCRLNKFCEEMELMRRLCEKTIAKTHLYFPTEPLHFYQLIKTLKPFLKPENLLFAEDKKGNTVGFLFWHPDFNQMLKGGKDYCMAGIAFNWFFNQKKIDTVKVNALGSLSNAATFLLINAFRQLVATKYSFVETSFVWDNNVQSSLLMKKLFGKYDRKYEVYYLE